MFSRGKHLIIKNFPWVEYSLLLYLQAVHNN